jgi:hypothetical protein
LGQWANSSDGRSPISEWIAPAAEEAVGIIFGFLIMEGSPDKAHPLRARLGRADALLRQAASDNAGGFGMSEVIGAGTRMMAAGPSMRQIQSVSLEVMTYKVTAYKVLAYEVLAQVLAYAREQVGAEAVAGSVVAIPVLWQFT